MKCLQEKLQRQSKNVSKTDAGNHTDIFLVKNLAQDATITLSNEGMMLGLASRWWNFLWLLQAVTNVLLNYSNQANYLDEGLRVSNLSEFRLQKFHLQYAKQINKI